MLKVFYSTFALFFSLAISSTAIACDKKAAMKVLQDYIWLTEDYPPYNYFDLHGNLAGMSVDILELVYEELQLPLNRNDVRVIPWARLVRDLKVSSKFAAFTMVYTEKRAQEYTLISTSLPTTISIMVLDETLEKLKQKPLNELTISVVRKDIGQLSLELMGVKAKQVPTTTHESMVNMLYRHRVDAIAFNEELVEFFYNNDTSAEHTIKTLHVLQSNLANNYVFHKDAPQCATQLFTEALARVNKSGVLQEISQRYLPSN